MKLKKFEKLLLKEIQKKYPEITQVIIIKTNKTCHFLSSHATKSHYKDKILNIELLSPKSPIEKEPILFLQNLIEEHFPTSSLQTHENKLIVNLKSEQTQSFSYQLPPQTKNN